MGNGNYEAFMAAVRQREASGEYAIMNNSGHAGNRRFLCERYF